MSNDMNTRNIINDGINRMVFEKIPDVFLVGGYVRDILIGRKPRDRDYAVKNDPLKCAEIIKGYIGGTIVVLKDGLTVRIALKNNTTVDFTRYENRIEEDLSRRDFTFNAIAFSPETGLYDPFNGIPDLRNQVVTMLGEGNIRNDPVRIIRAYRFAGELNGTINVKTRDALSRYRDLLREMPSERITLEFLKTLEADAAERALREMLEDGILRVIIPLNYKELKLRCNKILEIIKKNEVLHKKNKETFTHGLCSFKALLMLEVLINNTDLKETLLRPPNRVVKRVGTFSNALDLPIPAADDRKGLYDFFSAAGDAVIDILVVRGREDLIGLAERFMDTRDNPVISGDDVMKILSIKGGPIVGEIIREVIRLRFAGTISTRTEAQSYVMKRYGKIS